LAGAEMVTLSHRLARVSRGWFIQPENETGPGSAVSADEQSDALRQRVLDAAGAAARSASRWTNTGWDCGRKMKEAL